MLGKQQHPVVRRPQQTPPPPQAAAKKKKPGTARTWMRFDVTGRSELLECDRQSIMNRASIPARDLRILGPVFSHSSNIIAREKAMVINLEFIKAVITAEEVFILDPKNELVLPFIDLLNHQLPLQSPSVDPCPPVNPNRPLWFKLEPDTNDAFPFEFRVLEIALEVVCNYLDTKVADLEHIVYPALDELTKNVSTSNLEHVRSLKSNLTRTTARVQKVRDEVEHLLDDDDEMAGMFLTRKLMLQQVDETGSNDEADPPQMSTRTATSIALGTLAENGDNVEELEMLLETCFLQIDGTRNKLTALREYIDDTEDYINIQLDNHRNQLIQLQLTLIIGSFVVSIATAVAGIFGMNIPYKVESFHKDAFMWTTSGTCAGGILIYMVIYGFARWKDLLGT